MGRGRGKGKKFIVTSLEDSTAGAEEKVSSQKESRSAEQPLKDEMKEEEFGKVEAIINDHAKTSPGKVIESPTPADTGKKRKRNSSIKEKLDLVNDANCNGTQTSIVQVKSNGFRHIGSRRKSKPRRAAESVVECR